MPRPSTKKGVEDKNKAPAPVAAAPQLPHQPMMPTGIPQGMPMQPQHQPRPQQQQFVPQVQMAQQPPPPVGVPPMQPQSGRIVDTESFVTVRDSAVGRLTTILELLRSFTTDYIRQTNLLLGEPTADGGQGDLLANFENAAAGLIGHPIGEIAPPVEEKKERKKRTHDPDAPKRPLTPYFLYMQTARSIIATDLGPDAPKGAVQEEGQRRWATMDGQEKLAWNRAYQYNLHLYNARVHSYKAGNMDAKNMTDDEAVRYADANELTMPDLKGAPEGASNDQDAIAQQLQQVANAPDMGGETDAKTPKKNAGGRKRKSEAAADPDASKVTAAPSTAASPDKKRRRTSGKPAAETEEPKKSSRKKTKSS